MIIDNLVSFDTNATVTGGTTTASEDYVNLAPQFGGFNRKLGSGRPLFLVVCIKSNTGGDGADTLTITLQTDSVTNFASPATVASSATFTGVATFPAGTRIVVPVPAGVAFEQYARVGYALTASAVLVVDSFLTDQLPIDLTTYPDAI